MPPVRVNYDDSTSHDSSSSSIGGLVWRRRSWEDNNTSTWYVLLQSELQKLEGGLRLPYIQQEETADPTAQEEFVNAVQLFCPCRCVREVRPYVP